MPSPKISAVLNNCPLHAITPELVKEIYRYGQDEHYDNHHNEAYHLLKNKFAEFYGFDVDNFSWEQFAAILKQYNPFDIQILMGPVLRLFIGAQLEINPRLGDVRTYSHIRADTARYESLDPGELAEMVCNPLGFSLKFIPQQGHGLENTLIPDVPLPIPTEITICHTGNREGAGSGGHWERTLDPSQQVCYEERISTQLLHYSHLLGHNANVNPTGFDLIKSHVQLTASLLEGNDVKAEFCNLYNAAAIIEKFLKNIGYVPHLLAIELLGPALNNNEIALTFIENFPFEGAEDHDEVMEAWLRAKNDFEKPVLKNQRLELAQELATPPVLIQPGQLPPTGHEMKGEITFYKKLALLQNKITELKNRKDHALTESMGDMTDKDYVAHHHAWEAATTLRIELVKKADIYFANPNEATYQRFKRDSLGLIKNAHRVLDNHRGDTEFLTNLTLGIISLGILVAIKGGINWLCNRPFLFVHETKSSQILHDIEVFIDDVDPNQPEEEVRGLDL